MCHCASFLSFPSRTAAFSCSKQSLSHTKARYLDYISKLPVIWHVITLGVSLSLSEALLLTYKAIGKISTPKQQCTLTLRCGWAKYWVHAYLLEIGCMHNI